MVALQHLVDAPDAPLDVEAARALVEHLQRDLPETAMATRPDELRRLASRALDAERAAFRRRSKVGEEPPLDDTAAAEAFAAHDAVRAARAGMSAATDEGMRWLAIGNVWGLTGLAAAGVMVLRAGYEPMSAPVYGAVIGGATGPITTGLLALARRTLAAMRTTSASAAWASALATTGFETMGQLGARRLARRGWERRNEEAAVATAAARAARGDWHRVAGPRRHPRDAPQLLEQLAALRSAQLELLRALIAERMQPRAVPELSEPIIDVTALETATVDVTPFDVRWATTPPAETDERTPRRGFLRFWRGDRR